MAIFTNADRSALRLLWKWRKNLSGPGVTNSIDRCVIQWPPPPPRPIQPPPSVVWFKVASLPSPGDDVDGAAPPWATCNTWDGTNAGDIPTSVRILPPHNVGDTLYAFQPLGGTDQTDDDGQPVLWQESGGPAFGGVLLIPSGTTDIAGGPLGGGWYSGSVIIAGTAATGTNDPTTNVGIGTFGTAGTTVYMANTVELGLATHGLDFSGTYAPIVFWGWPIAPAADGTPCYGFEGVQTESCT